jgi:hypothetical protein
MRLRLRLPVLLLIGLGVILVGIGVWIYALPYMTALRLKTALEHNDAAALSREIDFERLRGNLKMHLNDYLERPPPRTLKGRAEGVLREAVSGHVTNRLVDFEVTPTGLGWLILGKVALERAGYRFPTLVPSGEVGRALSTASCQYESTSLFSITVHRPDGGETRLLLGRTGLTWLLVDVTFSPLQTLAG